ncbi:MAG: hypothetical protein A3K19_05035 [Lentisphaerae bacterium RIFOXYB12_FULL_65_16]|nr:MAG: hypothetical protein A3K18_35315 [Lentisphaerae bacterium RIFOXYA12_64_32]OGV89753.1 MAG: hypothetical protein A3K19_05035 [Lentisphaerae bacterium RIFOXYB12_FULL_65_16]
MAAHSRQMLVSQLRPPNPLPRYRFQVPVKALDYDATLTGDDIAGRFMEVHLPVLPYTMQDDYGRAQAPGEMPTIDVENDRLKAVFYPDDGGRMASLYDKRNRRELLFDNPVFQPANLALRNAWFAGGVEWNCPVYGHSMQTCSPIFAATVPTATGDILRLYEFDRLFGIVWQVDVYLPAASSALWVHVTLRNPHAHDCDVYWWTNIAVPLTERTRVLSPAAYAVMHRLSQRIERVSYPFMAGFDASYPANYPTAESAFVRPAAPLQRPWQAYVDESGRGMAHLSSPELHGRKIFAWGHNPGGKHWMDYLSLPGRGDYIELQGGITATQLQMRPLAAHSRLEWTECYMPLALAPREAHGTNYATACDHACRQIDADLPQAEFDAADAFLRANVDTPVSQVLHHGSAWGHLQETLYHKSFSAGLAFDAPISDEERPWHELLTTGTFSAATLARHPTSWNVSADWVKALQASQHRHGATWLHHLYLGVATLEQNDLAAAEQHFLESQRRHDSFEAARNLALIRDRQDDVPGALECYLKAYALSEQSVPLAAEIVMFLKARGLEQAMVEFTVRLPEHARTHERIRIAFAEVALAQGRFAEVHAFFDHPFNTIREGEKTLTDLWFALHIREEEARRGRNLTPLEIDAVTKDNPPPMTIDFRMTAE